MFSHTIIFITHSVSDNSYHKRTDQCRLNYFSHSLV